ncbi:hypothetical protein COOONC_13218 [Cooperia oncophora]
MKVLKNGGVVCSDADGPIYTMRAIFPAVSCFFSYVNAWMILCLNDDIRRKVLSLIGFRNRKIPVLRLMSMSTSVKTIAIPTLSRKT